jgi:hypothetical protein
MAIQNRPARYAMNRAGVNPTYRSSVQEADLGAKAEGNQGQVYTYCYAAAAVPAGACTVTFTAETVASSDTLDANDTSIKITRAGDATAAATCTVDSTAGTYTNDAAFAAGEYGWVRKTALVLA